MHFIKHLNNELVCCLHSTENQSSTDEMPTNDIAAIGLQVEDWYTEDYDRILHTNDGILYHGEVL